jgi:hypothetical protein
MMALLWVLLGRAVDTPLGLAWSVPPALGRRVALIAFGLLPALNIVGLWDAYFSWNLYSGIVTELSVYVEPAALPCLPADFRRQIVEFDDDIHAMSVTDWAIETLGVPPYPERWTFRRLRDQLCVCDRDGTRLKFVLSDPARWRPTELEWHRCGEAW